MPTARESFLNTVRQAVTDGNRAGVAPTLPARGNLGYQGAGNDPAERFAQEFQAVGGHCHIVQNDKEAISKVTELVQSSASRQAVVGQSKLLKRLKLAECLQAKGVEIWSDSSAELPLEQAHRVKETLFQADLGVTGVDWLIAETGTIVLNSRPGQARSLSLLPPVHIAVAEKSQILPDLFDLLARFPGHPPDLPACLTLITGPSKTGDIELRLVTGVHGPGEVHVVLMDSNAKGV